MFLDFFYHYFIPESDDPYRPSPKTFVRQQEPALIIDGNSVGVASGVRCLEIVFFKAKHNGTVILFGRNKNIVRECAHHRGKGDATLFINPPKLVTDINLICHAHKNTRRVTFVPLYYTLMIFLPISSRSLTA